MTFDGKVWGEQIVEVVKGYVEKATAPLLERIAELEDRLSASSVALTESLVSVELGYKAAIAAIPTQEPKGVDEVVLAGIVEEKVAAAVSAIPLPKDGAPGDPGRDGLDVKDLFVADGGDLIATFSDGRSKNLGRFRGEHGKDADLAAVEQLVQARLAEVSPKELELAPPSLAERISLAVKMMAQMPETPIVQREYGQAMAPNFTVNLPPAIPSNVTVNLPQTEIPVHLGENVVNVSVPEQKAPEVRVEAPVVNVTMPEAKKRRMETTVTEHDENGRIARFVQKEL